MKSTRYFKTITGNKFYIKVESGYYRIINRLDMRDEALCLTEE